MMKKRILIIDDEESVRDFMKKILTRSGYMVFTASDGREAVDMLGTVYVDLIILDMNMPNMNGIDVLRHIRESNLTNKPVLMVSGSHDSDLRTESYRLGAYDFITKPEHTEVMLKRIENGLKIGEILDFNEFMKVELFMAKKLQKYIFPDQENISECIDIYAWNLPLSDIGGDLYDYIQFRNNKILLFVADVSGHSISASMFTAIVKMVFRNAVKTTEDPGEIMTIVNHELSMNLPVESFVTMFCCLIDGTTGSILYSNAGHPKPYIIGKNKWRELTEHDPFLGPIKDTTYSSFSASLGKDEMLFIYTDGLLDIIDDEFRQVKLELFIEMLASKEFNGKKSFDELKGVISDQRYIRSDDCTVMVLRKK
jgi:sigma-B regulation protein RsbU (phosphoserine phosphatase)